MAKQKTGLFIASYKIGKVGAMGSKVFTINLSVYTPDETVSGGGQIFQSTNPPLDIHTSLTGQYSYMCVMPKNCHILVTAKGYPISKWPTNGGVGPVMEPNVDLRMVLTDDWKSGSADYSYKDSKGNWIEVKDAPVQLVTGDQMASL